MVTHVSKYIPLIGSIAAACGLIVCTSAAFGCPFCTPMQKTLSEDLALRDVVVIAKLSDPRRGRTGNVGASASRKPTTTFTIDRILKGKSVLGDRTSIEAAFFGESKATDRFLLTGSDPRKLTWSAPVRLNNRQLEYVLALSKLPKEGPKRLEFFQKYLRDSDKLLADDAYNEFALAPYDLLKQLKKTMNHDQLVEWINDPAIPANKRRLYLTMLGVCGTSEDLPMLEKRLRSSDPQDRAGLDALIACYLTLRGPQGVELIERLFFLQRNDNFSDSYPDVYSAIMALRFHGMQQNVIPRKRVLEALRCLLDNPAMADLIIPDLARWEDWSQLDRLVELFRSADSKTSSIRMWIINYARACPLPEAKRALEEFKKIDPDTYKHAMTFFPSLPGSSK